MGVKEAAVMRIKELCDNNNIALNELAVKSGITPSTVYSVVDPSRKDVGIVTLKKICDGLEITLEEFFASPAFRDLEQELK